MSVIVIWHSVCLLNEDTTSSIATNRTYKSMICALTHEECELRNSHIYPKFMWDFLKTTGGDRFRPVNAPTQVLQDGEKSHLLSHRAEQMFSSREKWFAEHIFMPFCNNEVKNTKISYDDNLYYFIISLLWRRFYTMSSAIKENLREQCIAALEEWRLYLLNGVIPPSKYNQIYIMPITPSLFFTPNFSLSKGLDITLEDYENCKSDFYPVTSYLLRTFDAEIYCSPNNHVFFCKVPRFFFWAIIERHETDLNFGIRVKPDGGTIDFKRYNIGNGEVKRFIFKRCYDAEQLFRDASNKLSDRNIDKMIERMVKKDNIEHLRKSEVEELLYNRVEYQSQTMDRKTTNLII